MVAGPATGDSGTMCIDLGGAGALANSFAGSGANGSTGFRVPQPKATPARLPGSGGGETPGAGALANSFAGSGANGSTDFRIRQRMATTVRLPGYGGGNTDTAAVVAYIQGRNNGSETGNATVNTATSSETGAPFGGGFVNTPGGVPCSGPTTTSIEPALTIASASTLSIDQSPGPATTTDDVIRTTRSNLLRNSNLKRLQQEDLNWMVQAAIARWIAMG